MPTDIAALIPSNPWLIGLVIILVVVRYVGQIVSEVSETGAKIFGPLGKRWRERAERERAREAADITDLKRQIEGLEPRVKALTAKVDLYEKYLEYDATWHRDDSLYGISQGWERRPPQHRSLYEFTRDRERELGQHD